MKYTSNKVAEAIILPDGSTKIRITNSCHWEFSLQLLLAGFFDGF